MRPSRIGGSGRPTGTFRARPPRTRCSGHREDGMGPRRWQHAVWSFALTFRRRRGSRYCPGIWPRRLLSPYREFKPSMTLEATFLWMPVEPTVDVIFSPLAILGMYRLFAALWLTNHFAYAPHNQALGPGATRRLSLDSLLEQPEQLAPAVNCYCDKLFLRPLSHILLQCCLRLPNTLLGTWVFVCIFLL